MKRWLGPGLGLLLMVDASGISAQQDGEGRGGDGIPKADGQSGVVDWSDGPDLGGNRVVDRRKSAPAVVPEHYVVKKGDTLWDITDRHFGDAYQWPKVWSYNPEITNPHWIYPDERIRLRGAGESAEALPSAKASGKGGRSGAGRGKVGWGRGRSGNVSITLRDEGYLDPDALAQSGVIVGSPEEHMLLSNYDDCYVKFDRDVDVTAGQELTVFQAVNKKERGKLEEGELVRLFGTVRVHSYDRGKRLAKARIVEAIDPIERGYRVGVVVRHFEMADPRRNEKSLSARVIATLRPRELLAEQQLIFVDVGSEQGVAMGNRFFLVEKGDRWRREIPARPERMGATADPKTDPDELPEEIVAEARVVDVRRNTSALLVTRSVREVAIGERAEMRAGY